MAGDLSGHCFVAGPLVGVVVVDPGEDLRGAVDAEPIDTLGKGIGQTVGSAAEIVVTTPFKVLRIVTGGE